MNKHNTKRNFVLLELGDNDFSTAMHDALEKMHEVLNTETASIEHMKNYLVQHMVAHTIIHHAYTNESVNWEEAKHTEGYLIKRLRVSTPQKIDFSKDYDSGAAYLDIRLGGVWNLNSQNYQPT